MASVIERLYEAVNQHESGRSPKCSSHLQGVGFRVRHFPHGPLETLYGSSAPEDSNRSSLIHQRFIDTSKDLP